jgi:hypothetical protein
MTLDVADDELGANAIPGETMPVELFTPHL